MQFALPKLSSCVLPLALMLASCTVTNAPRYGATYLRAKSYSMTYENQSTTKRLMIESLDSVIKLDGELNIRIANVSGKPIELDRTTIQVIFNGTVLPFENVIGGAHKDVVAVSSQSLSTSGSSVSSRYVPASANPALAGFTDVTNSSASTLQSSAATMNGIYKHGSPTTILHPQIGCVMVLHDPVYLMARTVETIVPRIGSTTDSIALIADRMYTPRYVDSTMLDLHSQNVVSKMLQMKPRIIVGYRIVNESSQLQFEEFALLPGKVEYVLGNYVLAK